MAGTAARLIQTHGECSKRFLTSASMAALQLFTGPWTQDPCDLTTPSAHVEQNDESLEAKNTLS